MYQAIVLLPLLGSIIAGAISISGPRRASPARSRPTTITRAPGTAHHATHDAAPRRSRPDRAGGGRLACRRDHHHVVAFHFGGAVLDRALAGRLRRSRRTHHAVHLDDLGRSQGRLGAADRHAHRRDAGGGDDRVGARAPLFDRLHGRGPVPAAVLLLPVALHLRHAGAGDLRQPRAAVLRLGGRGPRELSADRLLVSQAGGERRRHQGLRRQPDRRFRLRARHLRRLHDDRLDRPRYGVRAGAGADRQDHQFLRLARRRADADLPAAVHGRDGQVGAVPAAHLAARRDGRPDAGLGADPRRHHGDRRRVHGGAAVAAVRAGADRTRRRHPRRRHHGVLRRDRRPGAERHQADRRLFDLLAARLHVRRDGRRRLFGRHVPPVHPRLLQGAAVPRLRLGDHGDAPRAGHPQHGRPAQENPVHLLDHGDRHAGANRIPVHRRLFLQGRHHRGGVRRQEPGCGLRLRDDRDRRRPHRVLLLAADLQDLPRRTARPASLRGGAGKSAGDPDPARGAGIRLDRRGLPVQGVFRRPPRRTFLPRVAQAKRGGDRRDAPRAALGRADSDGDDAPGLGHLGVLLPAAAGHPGRARAPAGRAVPLPAQQVVLRRDLRLPVRQARAVARPRVLEGRRWLRHRRLRARRRVGARARRHP